MVGCIDVSPISKSFNRAHKFWHIYAKWCRPQPNPAQSQSSNKLPHSLFTKFRRTVTVSVSACTFNACPSVHPSVHRAAVWCSGIRKVPGLNICRIAVNRDGCWTVVSVLDNETFLPYPYQFISHPSIRRHVLPSFWRRERINYNRESLEEFNLTMLETPAHQCLNFLQSVIAKFQTHKVGKMQCRQYDCQPVVTTLTNLWSRTNLLPTSCTLKMLAADCSKRSYFSTSLHGVIFMAAAVSCYLPVNNIQELKTAAICVRIRVQVCPIAVPDDMQHN